MKNSFFLMFKFELTHWTSLRTQKLMTDNIKPPKLDIIFKSAS